MKKFQINFMTKSNMKDFFYELHQLQVEAASLEEAYEKVEKEFGHLDGFKLIRW